MRGMRFTTALVALIILAALPAAAAVSGTGGGTLEVNTQVIQKPDDITFVTRNVIDDFLASISGTGTVSGAGNASFHRGAVVSQANVAQALANIQSLLTNDVNSIPGRTWQFSAGSSFTGSQNLFQYSENERTFDGTTTESDRTVTASDDAIIIGDPDSLEGAYVAQGTVTQTTVIENTDHYTDTTTNHYDNVAYYQVNVNRIISPLVLNLDGTGKLGASGGNWLAHEGLVAERLRLFDFYGNGFPVAMEWVGPNDGLLCQPKADGSVDGTCLFGTANGFSDGFEELAVRDADGDMTIKGAELAGLQVWQDRNGNATVQPGELRSVEELGITAISLRHTNFASSFTMNGESQKMWDWWPNALEVRRKDMARTSASR